MEVRGPDVFRCGRSYTKQLRLACDPAERPEFRNPALARRQLAAGVRRSRAGRSHQRDIPSTWMPPLASLGHEPLAVWQRPSKRKELQDRDPNSAYQRRG